MMSVVYTVVVSIQKEVFIQIIFLLKVILPNFYLKIILFRLPMYLWSWLCIWEKDLCWHWWVRQQSMCQWKLYKFGRRFQMPMSRRIQPRTWRKVIIQIQIWIQIEIQIKFSLQSWHKYSFDKEINEFLWQLCAAMMSWVGRWVELVVY